MLKVDGSLKVDSALRWIAFKVDSPPSRACGAGRAGLRHGERLLKRPPEEQRRPS